jgi:hypothetical protein
MRLPLLLLTYVTWASPTTAGLVGFEFPPPGASIVAASFSLDVAELTAHRYIGDLEVNRIVLTDQSGTVSYSLSETLFGNVTWPDPPLLALGTCETWVLTVPIDPAFFPVLQSGVVGLEFMLTETSDAMFAIDSMWLTIETADSQTLTPYYGSPNDGFLHGIPDNGALPEPAQIYLPPGWTRTGFDETIWFKVPEPGTAVLLGLASLVTRRRGNRT